MAKSSSSSTRDKKDDKKEPSIPKKTERPAPMMVRPATTIKGKVFKNSKDVPRVFTGTFENCEFDMKELEGKNLSQAKFKNCKFSKDFKFVNCNLVQAKGVDKVTMEKCLKPLALHKTKKTAPRKEKR